MFAEGQAPLFYGLYRSIEVAYVILKCKNGGYAFRKGTM